MQFTNFKVDYFIFVHLVAHGDVGGGGGGGGGGRGSFE